MKNRLPYQLIAGVWATGDGLLISTSIDTFVLSALRDGTKLKTIDEQGQIMKWSEAARLFRYKPMNPWCGPAPMTASDHFFCYSSNTPPPRVGGEYVDAMARSAAVVCQDGQGWRILYWCIKNLS